MTFSVHKCRNSDICELDLTKSDIQLDETEGLFSKSILFCIYCAVFSEHSIETKKYDLLVFELQRKSVPNKRESH